MGVHPTYPKHKKHISITIQLINCFCWSFHETNNMFSLMVKFQANYGTSQNQITPTGRGLSSSMNWKSRSYPTNLSWNDVLGTHMTINILFVSSSYSPTKPNQIPLNPIQIWLNPSRSHFNSIKFHSSPWNSINNSMKFPWKSRKF